MKKFLVLLLALVVTCMSFVSCGCQEESDLEKIEDAGKIVIGITEYEPMDFQSAPGSGNWIGFDAELAKMFADSLGVACEFKVIKWANKIPEINSNQIDLIWNGMTASSDLNQSIDFSLAYARNAQVAVVQQNSTLTAQEIKNSSVAVEKGSAGSTVAKNTIGATALNELDTQALALKEVVYGTSQVAIVDLTMAQYLLQKDDYAGLKILDGARFGDEVFAIGLRKGSDIKAKLDAFLKEKYADGTMRTLAQKYGVELNDSALI